MHLLSHSQYMFSLLRLDAVLKRQSVLSNRRGGTGKKKKRLFIVEPAVSESCKNFGEPRRATGWRYVMLSENVETNKS